MSKFREFTIGAVGDVRGGPIAERAAKINLGLAPFRNAVDWAVWHRRPDGPFAKLAIEVVDGDGAEAIGYQLDAVCMCKVATDLTAAAGMSTIAFRDLGGELTVRVLTWVEDTYGWTDPWLIELIDRSRRQRGPYRYEIPNLRITDRRTGWTYVPFVEFGDDSTVVRVEDVDRDQTTVRDREVARSERPVGLDHWFDPRKARLIDGRLVYLDRTANVIASLPVGDLDDPGPG